MSDYQSDDIDQRSAYIPNAPWRNELPEAVDTAVAADVPFDLACIAEALPSLGVVLWLDRRECRVLPMRATTCAHSVLMLDHPALTALEHCRRVTAHTAVTPRGPREWLCFLNGDGVVQNKMFLLPDTDCLAWDQMAANCHLAAPLHAPESWHSHTAFLRCAWTHFGIGWRARLLRFDLKRQPCMRTLAAQPPLRISLLGIELVQTIVRDEGAELVSPQHCA